MELVRSGNTRYEEYEALLTERDALRKEAESVWIRYVQAFGERLSHSFAFWMRRRRTFTFVAALNR